MRLHLDQLDAGGLDLAFENFRIQGTLRAGDLRHKITGSEGRVRAHSVEIEDLRLTGSVAVAAKRMVAKDVEVSWSSGEYRVKLGELQVPTARVELAFGSWEEPPERTAETAPASAPKGPFLAWEVLDGLSGTIDVDVLVDMKVPVIGSRKAKHPLRVFVESGAVNYLDLERDLSALEDALLDFAVRDGALVLERGLPLWPTRGCGKKVISWQLSPDDLALTKENQVRLAVLPHGRLVPQEGSHAEPAKPNGSANDREGLVLEKLDFADIQALLRLEPAPTPATPIRELSFDEVLVQGNVHHEPANEPLPGGLTGTLRKLKGRIVELPFGASAVDLDAFHVGGGQFEVPFHGLRPRGLTLELSNLHIESLSVESRKITRS